MLLFLCALAFSSTFYLVLTITSVGYHRALCHSAVKLHPWVQRALMGGAVWLTAVDPKAWVVMHRMHHRFSDGERDPHAPRNVGWRGMLLAQIRAYNSTIDKLRANDPELTAVARELEMSWPARSGLWIAPYIMHGVIGFALSLLIPWPIVLALWLGLVSHALQGAITNYFGHAVGGRNFDLPDDSRNNHVAAWFLFGEGFQNNHHRHPTSARFSFRNGEWDPGYLWCRLLQRCGVLRIEAATLVPTNASAVVA